MKTYIVDAFTDKPFTGNPAGVCLVKDGPANAPDDATMLLVAQELGLSETAFIQPISGSNCWSIRFFSPVMEIPLCGHATLAAAAVLFERLGVTAVTFVNINHDELAATEAQGQITLAFPIYETQAASVPPAMLRALGLSTVDNVAYNEETKILLLEIGSADVLANLSPNYSALVASHATINGVLVTAPANAAPSNADGYDFHSRYFWPWSGTNEDPVTGGTHTFLAKYWAAKLGKTQLRSFQSSKRTGFMQVDVSGDKLLITSEAQIVLAGDLRL